MAGSVKSFINEVFHEEILKVAVGLAVLGVVAQKAGQKLMKEFSR